MQKDKDRINTLMVLAKESDFPRVKIAAGLYIGNELISQGVNSIKTHPVQKKLNLQHMGLETAGRMHAETCCLLPHLEKDLSKATLYVARPLLKHGYMGLCRPCKSCMALIRSAGIRKVVYTTESGIAVESLL